PTADATLESATLARILAPGDRPERGFTRTVQTVALGSVLDGTAPGVLMGDGDSLTVFAAVGGERGSVTIAGSVWQPGTYQLTEGMRLWDGLQAAGGLRPETYRGRVQVLRTMPDSTRRMFGVALPAEGGGAPSENPPLMERDSVVVYARTAFRPRRWVAVGGAVQQPDTFAFAEAMTLRDAVLLAGGVTDAADLTEAVVTRVGITGISTHRVPLDSSYVFDATAYLVRPAGSAAPDFTLTPGDAVTIRTVPGWVPPQRVVLTGAVADPGTYLVDGNEPLRSLLARAGGVTPQALPGGIALYRSAPEGGRRRVGVDIERDLVLLAGDSIHIPVMNTTVRIEGAVNQPTVVAHRSGAGIGHYVSAGGGWAQNAHRNETYVIQANGIVERGGTPGPGSTVVVPGLELEFVQPSVWSQALPAIISGVASLAATIATIIVFSNR
ncbi:MAG: SLBB domain-containing protein, partial [Gemmatimonadales bacterium]